MAKQLAQSQQTASSALRAVASKGDAPQLPRAPGRVTVICIDIMQFNNTRQEAIEIEDDPQPMVLPPQQPALVTATPEAGKDHWAESYDSDIDLDAWMSVL